MTDGQGERQLIDFDTHMHKIGGNLADAMSFLMASAHSVMREKIMQKEMKDGNFDSLPEIHHLTTGYKSFFSLAAQKGIDELRRCCGASGYSDFSLFPDLIDQTCGNTIAEGDGNVLAIENTKLLFKQYKLVEQGEKV